MNLTLDSGKLLYGLGVAFALGALVYFARDVVFGLSITVTAALLLVAFVGFLLAGLSRERDLLGTVAFTISGLSYVVFLGYVVSRYEPGETVVFFLLAGSAALFVGLGYGVREAGIALGRRTTIGVVIALLVVSASLVTADALGGDVSYTVETNDTTTVALSGVGSDTDRVRGTARVGTLTATNPSWFTRPVDLPSIRGCLAGVEQGERSRANVDYEPASYDTPNRLGGQSTRVHELTVSFDFATNQTGDRRFAVERRGDCEPTRSEPTLFLVVDPDDDRID
ncbi:hypothetical protein [Halomicrobium sp. LC1Hm]|uniref:hypothetical protein n=1 Tax=Halomicrobium sp. LC1Hm TaxID=2610902 RepID=UPI0012985255|nr:hypothetical protein [Halomicrobium sp. LC1Hm]QGA81721.1 putative membrane protein [Halomicrobium sp. LC1Hm]